MAEQDSTTTRRKIAQTQLSDAISLAMHPLKDFLNLMEDKCEGETGRILRVLDELLERQKQELKKIHEAIARTLGLVYLENPLWGECVTYEGRKFRYPEIIRATLTPVNTPAPAPLAAVQE